MQKQMSANWNAVEFAKLRRKMKLKSRHLFEKMLHSVISPLLFIIFIDDLLVELGERVSVSGFADDLAVWQKETSLERIENNL